MKKKYLILGLVGLIFVGCSNAGSVAGEQEEALQLMAKKRQYYKKIDEEKARQQREIEKKQQEELQNAQEVKVEGNVSQEEIVEVSQEELEKRRQEEEKRLEKERIKNMTPEEKLDYRMGKAKEQVQFFLEKAKAARQEEIDNEAASQELEKKLEQVMSE